jgi:hypothetical protein
MAPMADLDGELCYSTERQVNFKNLQVELGISNYYREAASEPE